MVYKIKIYFLGQDASKLIYRILMEQIPSTFPAESQKINLLKQDHDYYPVEKLLSSTAAFHKLIKLNQQSKNRNNHLDKFRQTTNLYPKICLKMQNSKRQLQQYLTKNHEKLNSSFSQYVKRQMSMNQDLLKRKKLTKLKKIKQDPIEKQTMAEITIERDDSLLLDCNYKMQPLLNRCFDSLFPSHRYNPTLATADKQLYLIGGYHLNRFETLSLFHKYDFDNGKWMQMKKNGDIPKISPCFHTTQIYKNYLIIVGGISIDNDEKSKRFNNELSIYNLEKSEWLKCRSNISLKHHASTLFGNNLMIHGGINDKQQFNEDLYFINFNANNITSPVIFSVKNKSQSSLKIAHHKIIHTYDVENNIRNQLKYDGVFSFGGQGQNEQLNNKVMFINCINKVGQTLDLKFKKWQALVTNDDKPCPRKNHSFSIVNKKGIAVMIGGIDEQENKLSDIWLFDLIKIQWIKINTQPKIEQTLGCISNHCASVVGSIVYIYNSNFEEKKKQNIFWALQTQNNQFKSKKAVFQTKLPSFKAIISQKQNYSLWNINE